MRYLIDTDYLIDATANNSRAVGTLARLRAHGLGVSIISYGEIFEGAFGEANQVELLHEYHEFLTAYKLLPLEAPIMEHFAHVRSHLRRAGQLIPDLDLLIAATAIHHELQLVTRNLRPFSRIPGLAIYESSP